MFLYEFAEKTAQKPDTVATYVRRNKKIFKNHVERRQKQIWLDEKAVDILLKKYPEVQKKQKKPLNKEKFEEIITKSLKTLYENQEILAKESESRECLKGLLAYVIMTVAKKRYDVSCRHKRTPSSSHYWGFFSFWTVELPLG